jgi:hypothetical protein
MRVMWKNRKNNRIWKYRPVVRLTGRRTLENITKESIIIMAVSCLLLLLLATLMLEREGDFMGINLSRE